MIEKRNAEQATRLHKLQRQHAIRFAGPTVTAGVVMHDQGAGHPFAQQRSEDIGWADLHAIDLAQCGDVATANAVARIEAKDVDGLLLGLT